MFKLPPGTSAFHEQVLRDARRYEEMVTEAERALGLGGLEALQAYHAEAELVGSLSHPEAQLIEDYRKLTSVTEAQRELEKSIARDAGSIDLSRELARAEGFAGVHSLTRAAERLALESPVEALRRAAEPAWSDIACTTRMYDTFASIAKEQSALEASLADSLRYVSPARSADAALAAAMKIEKPWIDVMDPARSFRAFGALSEIGDAIKALRLDDLQTATHLRSLLGTWTPPADFALWDEAQRLATYFDAGIDPRLFDIPADAFEEAAWAAGIVQPAPEIHPERTDQGKPAKPSARRRISITYQVSISQDAQAQVNSIELMLREELAWRAATKHGPGWKKKFIHGNVFTELKERQAGARVGKSEELLDFTTFGELIQVIQRKDMWESCFGDVPMSREEFRVSVERLVELRNAVGHVRRLDPVEFIWVFAEATRLQQAFGIPPFTAEDDSGV